MDHSVRKHLKSIVATHGPSIGGDPRRLEALLRDVSGDSEKEITALVIAARRRIPADLQGASGVVAEETLVRRLEDVGLNADVARWAVEAWKSALGSSTSSEGGGSWQAGQGTHVPLPRGQGPTRPEATSVSSSVDSMSHPPQNAWNDRVVQLQRQRNQLLLAVMLLVLVCGAVALAIVMRSGGTGGSGEAAVASKAAPVDEPRASKPTGSTPAVKTAAAPASTPAADPNLVSIPGGTFWMGSHDGGKDEAPVTQVTLSPYLMDRTEVTVAAFRECVNAGKCAPSATVDWSGLKDDDKAKWSRACNWGQPGRDNHPINCVDWTQAKAYCEWKGGRLPTEAEWEYAARGKDAREYPWGNESPDATKTNACDADCVAWAKKNGWTWTAMHKVSDGFPTTAPVGSFPGGASPFGLQDMAGNVWEWVEDAYAPYPGGSITNPKQETGPARVDRGGGWDNNVAVWLRGATRSRIDPAVRSYTVGFRCARGASSL
jgi:formylglycine-generating enzyme required for sulfatase activity